MLAITFAWGSCFLAISVGLADAPILWFAALRALIAGTALLAVAKIRRQPAPSGAGTWTLIAVMGLVNVSLAFSAMFAGLGGLSTGAASTLANAQPLLIVLPAWWIYKERPSMRTLAAMGTGFAGLAAVALSNGSGSGAWLSIVAALAVTGGTLISRRIKALVLPVIAWHFLIGGAVLAVAAAISEGMPAINWNLRFVAVLLYVSLVGTAAAFLGWFTEVRHCRLDEVSSWVFLVPVFGILLSMTVLGERPSAWTFAGMLLILASIFVLVLSPKPAATDGKA
ncbi:DMT family transporter (plasmid) [Pseudarthrobacter defluvii]|nr:DMT family transporter [Pseudarthrobacter defluvii]